MDCENLITILENCLIISFIRGENEHTSCRNFELSVAERIQIVEDIWDSVRNAPEELSLSETEKLELDKRLENYQQNPTEELDCEGINYEFF